MCIRYINKDNWNKYKGYLSQKCLIKQQLYLRCNHKAENVQGKRKSGTKPSSHGHTAKQWFMYIDRSYIRNQESGRFNWHLAQLHFSLIPSFHRSTVSLGNGKKIENYLHSWMVPKICESMEYKKRNTVAQGQLNTYAKILKSWMKVIFAVMCIT